VVTAGQWGKSERVFPLVVPKGVGAGNGSLGHLMGTYGFLKSDVHSGLNALLDLGTIGPCHCH
jgi:hypothetical protein